MMNLPVPLSQISPTVTNSDHSEPFQKTMPEQQDILCGRGKSTLMHFGNRQFTRIIQDNLNRYIIANSRKERSQVVSSIVRSILADGIRFLKQDPRTMCWYELNVDQAHEKTGHAVRDMLKKLKRQQNDNNASSSLPLSRHHHQQGGNHHLSSPQEKLVTISQLERRLAANRENEQRSNRGSLPVSTPDDNSPTTVMASGLFNLRKVESKHDNNQPSDELVDLSELTPLPISSEINFNLADISRIIDLLSN